MYISANEMNKYKEEKWYKAFKEVFTYFILCSHSRLYRHMVSRRYRQMTNEETEEMGRFVTQHVNDNEELACELIDHLTSHASPVSPSLSLMFVFFGVLFGCIAMMLPPEDRGVAMVHPIFWSIAFLISLVIVFTQFPHRHIIETRSKEPGGMLRVLEEITRMM